jgi:hypothetical protein
MHISRPAQRVLKLVFAISSAQGSLTRPRLERRSGLSRVELHAALAELAQVGLLDTQRLRLTLPGLAFAVACGSRARAKARPAAPRERRQARVAAPIALFSVREPARAVA